MAEGQETSETAAEIFDEDEFGQFKKDRAWTMNEIRDHPLFMEDMPRDINDNPHLLALQSLIYDGQTPEQLAEHFRKLGNEAFRSSSNHISSQNALMAYTRGLEMECKDEALNSQLYSNRAAVSLRLKEYDKAVNDCRCAIKLDSSNTKAQFRAAKASEALGLTSQALEFCKDAVRLMPNEKEVRDMQARLMQRLQTEEQGRVKDRRSAENAKKEQYFADLTVVAALERRHVTLGPPMWDMGMYTRGSLPRPKLAAAADASEEDGDAVHWPLLMLYDETNQSDFVETFDDRCALEDQLQLMFPEDRAVEWDEEGKYVWNRLACYLERYAAEEGNESQMLRVPIDAALQEHLRGLRVPPCLVFHIFVNGTPAHEHFCKAHALQGQSTSA